MKILVIGSRGFIGSNVSGYFSVRSNEVWGCDVVTDYTDPNYFLIDATNADYEFIFEQQAFDVCINCSGASSVPASFVNPSRDFLLNVFTLQRILEAIRKHTPSCRFLNLSSAAVYGNPSTLPVAETHPAKPLSPYGWHKWQSELLCQEFHQLFGLKTASLRIFSAFGDGLTKQLFWDWHRKLKETNHIQLVGTGNESRDFISIDDIMQAIDVVINRSPFAAEVINVANGEEIFIKDAIRVFKNKYGKDFTYEFDLTVRKGDPLNWKADISGLSAMGYKQQVSFEEGIERYIRWLRAKG